MGWVHDEAHTQWQAWGLQVDQRKGRLVTGPFIVVKICENWI
ncbi:hypothetical protein Lp90_2517 [Lactiplantibacillus plantarum]|jgi:hypothetical protein|uniref:Uncharacterized protein n=1 Tax=Lactiplantibacillus plantarum TaxID=1590 RepID=A0A162HKE0_LACPN|nr:hypothetical protein HMPREF0531_12129 [Lactiplantibacillus plantarum subsp. plantarum ATCC 14917 = JCM 1149 = CGMCC 1.2437]KEZ12955.1 hypothetical protein Lp90_2517 [Lactiplantibacillus plantarum]KZD96228.1 hypothetical protein FBR5_1624 [Lactiplantibacillus plantarum]KZU03751.1 hypothetical protein Nizo2260_1991 [Lactiplantibacillus plantarum]KZU07393.1 hypothetical protein Nizo2263_2027 [Lactiplantibacillus plantarum]